MPALLITNTAALQEKKSTLLNFSPTPSMSKKRYKVTELNAWYRSISQAHRDYFRNGATIFIDDWIKIHNSQGIGPAMLWWKQNNRPLPPIQKACLDYLLERTIRNGANFSLPVSK